MEKNKKSYYDRCYDFKMEVIEKIQELLGDKVEDFEDKNYEVLVQEHIAGGQFTATLESVASDGFTADGEEYSLRDMNLDDLCVICDCLMRGEW